MAENSESYSKPSYDGRLKYYDHLKEYWDGLKNAMLEGDIDLWYRFLRGYYSRTHSYMHPKKKESILKGFNEIVNKMYILTMTQFSNQQKWSIEIEINNKLQEIEDELFNATKDMLLPVKTEVEGDFDVEEFMRQSDLAG